MGLVFTSVWSYTSVLMFWTSDASIPLERFTNFQGVVTVLGRRRGGGPFGSINRGKQTIMTWEKLNCSKKLSEALRVVDFYSFSQQHARHCYRVRI